MPVTMDGALAYAMLGLISEDLGQATVHSACLTQECREGTNTVGVNGNPGIPEGHRLGTYHLHDPDKLGAVVDVGGNLKARLQAVGRGVSEYVSYAQKGS